MTLGETLFCGELLVREGALHENVLTQIHVLREERSRLFSAEAATSLLSTLLIQSRVQRINL